MISLRACLQQADSDNHSRRKDRSRSPDVADTKRRSLTRKVMVTASEIYKVHNVVIMEERKDLSWSDDDP